MGMRRYRISYRVFHSISHKLSERKANESDIALKTRREIPYLPATIVSRATMYAATTYYFDHYANILLTRISRLQLDISLRSLLNCRVHSWVVEEKFNISARLCLILYLLSAFLSLSDNEIKEKGKGHFVTLTEVRRHLIDCISGQTSSAQARFSWWVLAWARFPQRNKATKWQFEWLNAETSVLHDNSEPSSTNGNVKLQHYGS